MEPVPIEGQTLAHILVFTFEMVLPIVLMLLVGFFTIRFALVVFEEAITKFRRNAAARLKAKVDKNSPQYCPLCQTFSLPTSDNIITYNDELCNVMADRILRAIKNKQECCFSSDKFNAIVAATLEKK